MLEEREGKQQPQEGRAEGTGIAQIRKGKAGWLGLAL